VSFLDHSERAPCGYLYINETVKRRWPFKGTKKKTRVIGMIYSQTQNLKVTDIRIRRVRDKEQGDKFSEWLYANGFVDKGGLVVNINKYD